MTPSLRLPILCLMDLCESVTVHESGLCMEHRDADLEGIHEAPMIPAVGASIRYVPEKNSDLRVDLSGSEYWMVGMEFSRNPVEGPAVITRDAVGRVKTEEYWVNGRITRFAGPSSLTYEYLPGRPPVITRTYHLDGSVFDRDEYYEILAEMPADELTDALGGAGYIDLLDAGADPLKIVATLRAGVITFEGVREAVLGGAPVDWVRSFEESSS